MEASRSRSRSCPRARGQEFSRSQWDKAFEALTAHVVTLITSQPDLARSTVTPYAFAPFCHLAMAAFVTCHPTQRLPQLRTLTVADFETKVRASRRLPGKTFDLDPLVIQSWITYSTYARKRLHPEHQALPFFFLNSRGQQLDPYNALNIFVRTYMKMDLRSKDIIATLENPADEDVVKVVERAPEQPTKRRRLAFSDEELAFLHEQYVQTPANKRTNRGFWRNILQLGKEMKILDPSRTMRSVCDAHRLRYTTAPRPNKMEKMLFGSHSSSVASSSSSASPSSPNHHSSHSTEEAESEAALTDDPMTEDDTDLLCE